ncbi:MAG: bifunctional folylpolyglutamate synthase/dihydrofolate synthase [Anaerolineae bacterium]|nr:bifunctional folylpolyglutamate synthase/dihydrofolate synthase [Anaerolineae bacterium]
MATGWTYRDALIHIYSFTDYEKKAPQAYAPEFYDLTRVHRLLALLGDPQRTFQVVHIAGTKGKGSTAAMAESVLRASGYRTGLYTSPHLHTFRERIQAGGALIPKADVARLAETMRPLVAQIAGITTFEVMTGLALAWFAEQGIEWAVLEVGLGGRLDATNVVTPAVSVITPISYDHTAILGDTLAQIATEKAGIIKPGAPVVSAPQTPEALAVIKATSRRQRAPLTLVGRDWTWQPLESDLDGQSFTIYHQNAPAGGKTPLRIPLLGEHQLVNATTAVAALSLLPGVKLRSKALRLGLEAVCWPGRLEILSRVPLLVVDSAHNGDSAQKLVAALRACCSFQHLHVVFGASADHATPELLRALLYGASWAVATRSRHPRAAEPAWLQGRARELGFHLEVSDSVAHALNLALVQAGPGDLVCCAGSVFVAAEARAAWFARQGLPAPPSDPV